ncbi:MAG: hypothetical protein RI554_08655 [Trueperaceae bacterium]|jgi:hypothetical protein|nr:hypothetical protein [Trueperaceae bacterium]
MVRLLVRHPVQDFAAWKAGYLSPDMKGIRDRLGVRHDAFYTTVEDVNDVLVIHDFDSADAAQAFLADGELQAALGTLGVAGEPKIQLFDHP